MNQSHLNRTHINHLIKNGCSSSNWELIQISPDTDLSRIRNVTFIGKAEVGKNSGSISLNGISVPCGLYNSIIADTKIGDNVRISNTGYLISNYIIEENVLIENAASLTAEKDAAFGNGTAVDVINEAGGRSVPLYKGLTSQIAYLISMRRNEQKFISNIESLILQKIKSNPIRNVIEKNAQVINCGEIKNVHIGPYAIIHGVQFLEDGTILSCEEQPTEIGNGVNAKSFIAAEGAKIDSDVLLDKVFVGQAVKLGKQFSAENSLFFANCEGFHGEAVSLFAGPYSVTHHKSTLLIAGLFSFYNAGSGSNQSNHMYKLGPVHQGIFERGCKTGSFSYVLLECHIAAFSVIIGKHPTNINAPNLPFSYIHEEDGSSKVIPGMNLFSVGTVRDGEKWPKRDNRKAPVKKDLIIFDVFSPYTIEKMRQGRNELLELSQNTPKEKSFVLYGGLQINRLLLRKGAKYYSMAITRYLNENLCNRLSDLLTKTDKWDLITEELKPKSKLNNVFKWTDISGLLSPAECIEELVQKVSSGVVNSIDDVETELKGIFESFSEYEWQYVYEAYKKEYDINLGELTIEQALAAAEEWKKNAVSLHSMILEDSKKEFGNFSKIGFGIDLNYDEKEKDFAAVRGSSDTNSVVQKISAELDGINNKYLQFKEMFSKLNQGVLK